MPDGWNYEACYTCKNFSANVSPRKWRCKLNNGTAKEKREFHMIWAMEFIRAHGENLAEDEIVVNYTGKKRKPK